MQANVASLNCDTGLGDLHQINATASVTIHPSVKRQLECVNFELE
jgi:hypothetical protein